MTTELFGFGQVFKIFFVYWNYNERPKI